MGLRDWSEDGVPGLEICSLCLVPGGIGMILKERLLTRERFSRTRLAEIPYRRVLIAVAEQIDNLIQSMSPTRLTDLPGFHEVMRRYSDAIRPWAMVVTLKMHSDVSNRDLQAWTDLGRSTGQELRTTLLQARTDLVLRNLLNEQVELIASLPLGAYKQIAWYVQQIGTDYTKEIARTGAVTLGRADSIANREVGRTSSLVTEAHAESVGSTSYIWRTRLDSGVRKLHMVLEGQVIPWGSPPIAGPSGQRAHAGFLHRCRCWPEPILPDFGGYYAIERGIEQRSYR